MRDENCIFCKLAGGDIPTNTIYEDEVCRVILDASPASKGHALVLPKEHFADLFAIDPETLAHVVQVAKKVAARMREVLGCQGVNLVQNNGEVAGQTVFHFHMHVIPRYEADDNTGVIEWRHLELSEEETAAICESLKM